MKISLFSQSLFALPLIEAIKTTAETGFEAIELACISPHLDYKTALENPEAAAAEIRNAGLAVSALSLFNNFADGNLLSAQLKEAEMFISLAPLFKTKIIKLTPGPPASRDAQKGHWECLEEALTRLVPVAEKFGVRLAFETHMGQLTDTLESTRRFLDMATSDCVGLTVDFSNLSFAGEKVSMIISQLEDRIYHTHIKNGYIDSAGGWHFQALDSGLTDYSKVIPMLRDAGYEGYLSIECLSPEAKTEPAKTAKRDLQLLKRYLKSVSEKGCN